VRPAFLSRERRQPGENPHTQTTPLDYRSARGTVLPASRRIVHRLRPAWIFHTGVVNADTSFEGQPIVINGTLYISSPHDHVFALNAATGALKWTYNPTSMPPIFQLALCCSQANRGVAVGDGLVFIAQLDATLVALNAKTGRVAWKTTVADWRHKYTENMAPIFVNGKVLVGISGGRVRKTGIRGCIRRADGKDALAVLHGTRSRTRGP